jgi:hypothetical protein
MIETTIKEINVDELMKKIRAEIEKKKSRAQTAELIHADLFPRAKAIKKRDSDRSHERLRQALERFQNRSDGYVISDFLDYHHRDFVLYAYHGILKRSPDAKGLDHFMKKMQSGDMTKAEVLGRLRYSPEGRSRKVRIKGLPLHFGFQLLFKIPILGYIFRLVFGFLNLPTLFRNFQKLETSTAVQLMDQRNETAEMRGRVKALDESYRNSESKLASKADKKDLDRMMAEGLNDVDASEIYQDNEKSKDLVEVAKLDDSQLLQQISTLNLLIITHKNRLKFLMAEARKRSEVKEPE